MILNRERAWRNILLPRSDFPSSTFSVYHFCLLITFQHKDINWKKVSTKWVYKILIILKRNYGLEFTKERDQINILIGYSDLLPDVSAMFFYCPERNIEKTSYVLAS